MTLEQLMKLFEERLQNRFFGKYAGVVTDVKDPLEIGRIRARVPAVLGEQLETGWALPCAPFGGGKDRGLLMLPEVGDTVWIEFAAGDVSQPIWVGAFWGAPETAGQQDDLAEEAGPEVPTSEDEKAGPGHAVLRTKSGHRIALRDDGDVIVAHGSGKTELRLTQDDAVVIKAEKAEIHLTAEGEVIVKAEKVRLAGEGAQEALVLGQAFQELFNQHTHLTGVGPSDRPTQLMGSSHLSKKAFTE